MACNIINSKYITINGGNTLYGGAITNLSFNFGGLSTGHKAQISVVKMASSPLSTPKNQDSVKIQLAGEVFNMHVGGYRLSTNANSPTTLSIDLYDQSNQFLDHDFIVLGEEFPNLGNFKNVHIVGDKYTTLPNKKTAELSGSIVPDADTKWGSARKFFENLKEPAGFFGGGGSLIDKNTVDRLVKSASGKSFYYTQQDKNAASGVKTLNDVLGNLKIGNFDNLAFDFSGSFREVVVSICNALGYFAYWDMSKQKIKIVKKFNAESGTSVLNSIAKSCNTISYSAGENFTVTSSQSAIGSFSSSDPGETSKMYGSAATRFLKATLLQPDFHYSTCSEGKKSLKLIDFTDTDVLKAITAAEDEKVFAMYVLQTMLKSNSTLDITKTIKFEMPGGANQKQNQTLNIKNEFDSDRPLFIKNEFLSKYYKVTSSSGPACEGAAYPVVPVDESITEGIILNREKEWNKKWESSPVSVAGESDHGTFNNGFMFIHQVNKFNTILGESSKLSSRNDILRNYLKAISEFKNRFYVVKDQTGLRTVRGNSIKRNYGFYMTSSTAGPSAVFNNVGGYQHQAINPYLSLKDAGGEFQALAKTIFAMYKREGGIDDFLSRTPVVDLIRALDRNELKAFVNRGYASSNVVDQDKLGDDFDSPTINMHILVKEKSTIEGPFGSNKYTEFGEGEFFDVTVNSEAVDISERIGQIEFSEEDGPLGKLFDQGEDDLNLMVVTSDDISEHIQPAFFNEKPLRKIKIEYNVEGMQSTIKKATGHFQITAAEIKDDRKVWSGNLIQNISINAADISTSNTIFNKFESTANDDSSIYSEKNQSLMSTDLKAKVKNNTWIDDIPAKSESLQFVLNGNVTLPSIEQGLQSLSIQSNDGNVIVDVSIGNENAKKSQIAMRKMRSEGSKLRHGYGSIIPDTTENFSPKFLSYAKGLFK